MLVTGGAGYIGSHTCVELIAAGHKIFVIDNLSNGNIEAIERIRDLSGCAFKFAKVDIRDVDAINLIFDEFRPDIIIYFAGLKAVGESVAEPVLYYDANVIGAVSLLTAMNRAGCDNITFSSSATV